MRFFPFVALGFSTLLFPSLARADDIPTKGKIVGVDLFKNGLAVVKCEVSVGKAGTYILEDVPQPVHGTFYFEGTAKVEASVVMKEVDVSVAEAGIGNLQEDLAGKRVIIQLKGANRPPIEGIIMKLKQAKGEATPPSPYGEYRQTGFLVLQSERGRVYLDPSEVSSIAEIENKDGTVKRRLPRLLLKVMDSNKSDTKLTMRYLTTGLSWAPSYRIDITDPKSLTLEQHAVIKNELTNLDGAEVRLISGFPNVQFAKVRSLLGPHTTLANFFNELEHRSSGQFSDVTSNQMVMGQGGGGWTPSQRSPIGTTLGATPTGEGVDLHYQPIGKRTLAEGDSLALTVAKGNADYQRIVEWLSMDHRDIYGRYGERGQAEESEDAWDALKFKNPLTFPMSTGPATVTANGAFNGQRTSYWVNPGEETILRVEKALSVRTRATENEKQAKIVENELIWMGSRQYRKVIVEGELAMSNNRKEAIQLVVRRRFSGELIKAEGDPKSTLLAEGVYSVNKRNELIWTMPLKGGEEKAIKYSYTVLVMH